MRPSPPIDELLTIARSDGQALDRTALDEIFHSTSPRVRFIKNLPHGASVLELGAGNGSMQVFRTWLQPPRRDLKLYAIDMEKGEHFDLYDGFAVGDYSSPDAFPGMRFDAVCSSNFVEHIPGGIRSLAPWAAKRLNPGGMLYVEGPSAAMKALPSTGTMREAGLSVSTMNFYDDPTHVDTDDLATTRRVIEEAGFFVEESGYWRNRYIEDEMLRVSLRERSIVHGTYAIWMKALVEQYVVAEKLP
jgi:SAM-dependent methyltransferase